MLDQLAGQNMNVRYGWEPISCRAADIIRARPDLGISSSLTDLDGLYGPAVIYTEWDASTGEPMLRDYLWNPRSDDGRCEHLVLSATELLAALRRGVRDQAIAKLDAAIDALYAAGAADRDEITLAAVRAFTRAAHAAGIAVQHYNCRCATEPDGIRHHTEGATP